MFRNQTARGDAPCPDRPWRRPGAGRYALTRLRGILRPPVDVYVPAAGTVACDRDVPIAMRDGVILRANVHRPAAAGPFPVLLSAHPYGKDALPRPGRRGHRVSLQYRMLRQTGRIRFSALTSWEAPDPAWWTARGYVVVNCDLRGAGSSDGIAALLSDQEGEDVHDLVEWAGAQPWSTGAVGLLGVSYLAISQWKGAAARPPSLRAICPWEGFTDAYRDLLRPGGIRETGFSRIWARGLRRVPQAYTFPVEVPRRPLRDAWWRSLVPELDRIEVPALICASFSDNNLHSRGSFRGFEAIGSADRFLYTHRSGKWATFYAEPARAAQLAFFERFLRGRSDVPPPPRVRLEVRAARDDVVDVRAEPGWPLERTAWTSLYFGAGGLSPRPPDGAGSIAFDARRGGIRIGWTLPAATELTGPMALRLWIEVLGAADVDLYAGVEKWHAGRYVPFEGSYGFGRDRVTAGWQRASLRRLDAERSRPHAPVPAFTAREPLRPGAIVPVEIALGPSATAFAAGDQLRLVVAGRWLWPRNPLTGQFPAAYERGPRGRCVLHWGPDRPARLLVPVIPAAAQNTGVSV